MVYGPDIFHINISFRAYVYKIVEQAINEQPHCTAKEKPFKTVLSNLCSEVLDDSRQ